MLPLRETVSVYLSILRQTGEFLSIDMSHGFYQQSLQSKQACHLVMIRVDKAPQVVPKMQLGHHGLSIRLYDAATLNEVKHPSTPVDLAICQL